MKRMRAELFLDIAWIVLACGYIAMSTQYPPAGRLIPMVVGCAALIAGLFQLMGNFLPKLRFLTHDRKLAQPIKPGPVTPLEDTREMAEVSLRWQWIALIWGAVLIVGLLLFGFVITMPLFFLAYFLVQRRQRSWKLAIGSSIVMGALTYGVFDQVLQMHLYAGVLFS
ncbi:tripartite tricarboxylate transporter TctB family protein [Alicyclobacillus suci]|uniref:tripartite tricarboxylate transporter TctB family protein n=1 Tax=Alicyclobacillus suci TaxID=2816080 RepID=UPI001A8FCE15|nr:tripartite tricarboxylate transporter TctB family protein [Alicyclobacillus suci]